jgi:hypothetical protein
VWAASQQYLAAVVDYAFPHLHHRLHRRTVCPGPVVSCLTAGNAAGSGVRSSFPRVRRGPQP